MTAFRLEEAPFGELVTGSSAFHAVAMASRGGGGGGGGSVEIVVSYYETDAALARRLGGPRPSLALCWVNPEGVIPRSHINGGCGNAFFASFFLFSEVKKQLTICQDRLGTNTTN